MGPLSSSTGFIPTLVATTTLGSIRRILVALMPCVSGVHRIRTERSSLTRKPRYRAWSGNCSLGDGFGTHTQERPVLWVLTEPRRTSPRRSGGTARVLLGPSPSLSVTLSILTADLRSNPA